MSLWLAASPLLLAILLILTKRASIANAGLIGAGLALALVWRGAGATEAGQALGRGLWIAWLAISIIAAGLVFQRLALAAAPDAFTPKAGGGDARSRAFAAIFLLGIFVESASGFGLGAVAAVAVLHAQGLATVRLAALALLSLSLVPWGALAIGTAIAASLTGLPLAAIGTESAVLSAPVMAAALALFWLWAPGERTLSAMLREAGIVAGLLAVLWAANRAGMVDVAGIIAAGSLFAFIAAWDRARGRTPLGAGPFAAFALFIVAIRVAPGVTDQLTALWRIAPINGLLGFAPLAHPSFWLVVFGLGYAVRSRIPAARISGLAGGALRAAWIPTAVTAGYIVLGEGMSAMGAQRAAAAALADLSGAAALYGAPVLAALAGWLTGSNAAAHGMLAELQAAIGAATGDDPLKALAIQNVVASAYTMLSPMRVALVAAALGLAGREAEIVRRLAPFALAVLVVAWAATALT